MNGILVWWIVRLECADGGDREWFSEKEKQSAQKRKEVNDGVKRRQTEERL